MGWLVAAAWWTIPIGAAPFLLALMHGPSVAPALRSFLPRPPKFSLASRAVRLRIQRLARAAHFLALDFGRGCAFSALQMVKQRGSNVGRAVAFFEQALDELILPFVFAALERGADLVERHISARRFHFIDAGRPGPLNLRIRKALDVANLKHLAP
jgi:hypothetical protein